MIKKFLLLWMLVCCIACSTDSPNDELPEPEPEESFDVNLTQSVNEVFVDVPFIVKVQSAKEIHEITWVYENGEQSIISLMPNVGLNEEQRTLYFGFAFPGTQDVVLEVKSITGQTITKTLSFEVKRGNAVKILGFKINSFYNMNGTWDAEYPETDENRLADVQFGFSKMSQGHFSDPYPSLSLWYRSPVYPNMQQLEWDLSREDLYISETSLLELSFIDHEEDGTGQDLTNWFRELKINFNDYREIKPSEINLANEEYGFDVTVQLEWL